MNGVSRSTSERLFHDRQAEDRARVLRPDDLCFADDEYLDHESWMRPAIAALGDVAGRRVLDLGCGHGMAAVVLARRGARVVACDLSPGYVREAQARARANGVAVSVVAAAGELLPFADESFEAVWAHSVLHHLPTAQAAAELRRILRPGGRVVLCEPWGENPCLNLARRYLPYPGKARTADETPLRRGDIEHLRRAFPRLTIEGHQLLAMASRLVRGPQLRDRLARLDDQLLRRFPPLAKLCRYVVVRCEK